MKDRFLQLGPRGQSVFAEERRRLLTFTVVGGGPTGCEFCGELSDFVRNDLRRFYPKLAPLVRIILIHRGKTLLPDFGESLQQAAREFLETQGIEVVLETTVDEVSKQQVLIASKEDGARGDRPKALPCGLVVWAAGQIGQDLVRDLHKAIPRQEELAAAEARGNDSQLFVDGWLRVCGAPSGSILALGDCARPAGAARFPNTAQVAAQQGAFVARLLNRQYDLARPHPVLKEGSAFMPMAQFRGQTEAVPFRFLDLGRLAYLGQSQAVAELGVGETTVSQSKGLAAFVLWRSVYIVKQVVVDPRPQDGIKQDSLVTHAAEDAKRDLDTTPAAAVHLHRLGVSRADARFVQSVAQAEPLQATRGCE
eukprot:s2467_g1.t1